MAGCTVLGQLMLPLVARRSLGRARTAALAALCDRGLEEWGARSIGELDDRELRDLALMRALLAEPDVLLVDNPTPDVDAREPGLDLLRTARERAIAVLATTGSAAAMSDADGVYTLSHGQLRGVRPGTAAVIPFTRQRAHG
jgi:ABC-type lipoprotein export system ATPase subunit